MYLLTWLVSESSNGLTLMGSFETVLIPSRKVSEYYFDQATPAYFQMFSMYYL